MKEWVPDATSPITPPTLPITESTEVPIPSVRVSPVGPEPPQTTNDRGVLFTEEASLSAHAIERPSASPTLTPQSETRRIRSPISPVRTPTPVSEPEDPKRQELLEKLSNVNSRYDELQKAFRGLPHSSQRAHKVTLFVPQNDTIGLVRITVQRLDDFNEDTRVELEIRSADEERVAQGFQTLLRVKGAIVNEEEMADIEEKVLAFVEGPKNRSLERCNSSPGN